MLTLLSVAFAVAAVLGTSLAQSMVRRAYAAMSDALAGAPALDIVAVEGGRFPLADVPPLNALQGIAPGADDVPRDHRQGSRQTMEHAGPRLGRHSFKTSGLKLRQGNGPRKPDSRSSTPAWDRAYPSRFLVGSSC